MFHSAIFKRYELKFILTLNQYHLIQKAIEPYMVQDKYGETDICNLYCDTSDFRLVRRSNEKPFYKEKLRIRSYGVLKEDMKVFI
ncbi:MAG: VTC domain-containing protein, partial [Anaeroplasmataceae bacterium]|nr:VTC domain-containing protein [Anaeroplasmataceae bacterium]